VKSVKLKGAADNFTTNARDKEEATSQSLLSLAVQGSRGRKHAIKEETVSEVSMVSWEAYIEPSGKEKI